MGIKLWKLFDSNYFNGFIFTCVFQGEPGEPGECTCISGPTVVGGPVSIHL